MHVILGIITGTGVVIAVPCLLLIPVFAIPPVRRYYRAQFRIAWEGLRYRRAPVPVSASAPALIARIRGRHYEPHDYVYVTHCDACYATWERHACEHSRNEEIQRRAGERLQTLTPASFVLWHAMYTPEPGVPGEPQDGCGHAVSTDEGEDL